MIFFKPTVDKQNQNEITFEALENDSIKGKCTLTINGNNAEIIDMEIENSEAHLVDGLIKSAFNYACSKNCYMGYCKCENIQHILDKMNFQKDNGVYFNDIPTILMGNCCKVSYNI